MEVTVKGRKYRLFAFDVESHNDDETLAKKETSIWLYSFINEDNKVDDESSYGYSIEQFLDSLRRETKREKGKICNLFIGVYNLSFEYSFILPVLLSQGFVQVESIGDKDENVFSAVTNVTASSVWELRIKFGKRDGICLFHDIAKHYGGGLRAVAKNFGLRTQKGDIDYTLNRLHSHVVTKEEKRYCFKDTRIIIDLYNKMIENNDRLFFATLSAASYAIRNLIKAGWPRSYKPYAEFRKRYPHLDKEEDDFLRKATFGGICYVTPAFQFRKLSKVLHIDMHQAHPSSAYLNKFPYGKGHRFEGSEYPSGKIACLHVKASYTSAKLHSVIPLIGDECEIGRELWIWDFELPTMRKCYNNLEVQILDGYWYDVAYLPWRKFYKRNYDARAKAKEEGNGYMYALFKLLNNSSYGKLLERGHIEALFNFIQEDGSISSHHVLKENANWEAKYTYLPVGSCIPAYTRVRLVETALKFGADKVIYFDTDSIFILDSPNARRVLQQINMRDELGGWGLERDIVAGQFAAPKRYKILEIEPVEGIYYPVIHMAGVNFREKPDYESIDIVSNTLEVQGSMKVKGGTIIVFKKKNIAVQPKYRHIYNENKDRPVI